jgi:hypothetical protein
MAIRDAAASLWRLMTRGKRRISDLAALVLLGAAVALPATAAADSAETSTSVAVRPGPLALYGVPAGRSFTPLVRCTAAGTYASLPAIRVVDATGSGRGWHLAVSVVGGGDAWARATVSAYNGPAELQPRSVGDVRLAAHPRTIAYALREHGMGTTVLSGVSVHSRVGLQVRFVLEPGP